MAIVDPRPFVGAAVAWMVLPDGGDAAARHLAELVTRERAEFAAELGAPVEVRRSGAAGAGPTMFLDVPGAPHPELAAWRRRTGSVAMAGPAVELAGDVVVVTAGDDAGVALSLLRTAVRTGAAGVLTPRPARTAAEAADRLAAEVAWTYPAFALRGLDWPALVARHREAAVHGGLDALQRWIAELRDPHTSVRAAGPRRVLPYTARGGGGSVRLAHVPRWSAGWAAGARPGDLLVAVGGEPVDAARLRATTGAEARTLESFAGRRALTLTGGAAAGVVVRSAGGRERSWLDDTEPRPVSWSRLPSGTGYLRIRAWSDPEALDAALTELGRCERLVVDVRGNSGGDLVTALRFRDRFLDRATALGTVRFSTGDGGLAGPAPITGTPAEAGRWTRPTRFLVDRLCYSATEDALLGLRTMRHVQLVGEPSGGGSGRPRTVGLLDGVVLSVSTALTYEPGGRCVEGAGLAVDRELPPHLLATGAAVTAADTGW
ncbi:hypothetical protein E1262_20255 [Jiangella aurantiaca]|uniref:Tail specific protease domain-containing protein n=1 Tax=Jiangella aurantiaca TaxID=2530373 RepID=A0A4R5A5A3_9ACTN|nr:S41 family peptidase [Jiangella aurantiaca]TDD67111.1 hypothetical protein E1262_20255 [Jiangella aurantiaca]